MNLNQYTDRIISILKKTSNDSTNSIWETLCKNYKICNNSFNKSSTETLDSVFNNDIHKLKQEDIIDIWECTDDGDVHICSYLGDPPEYEGDIILDIKNEIFSLITIDIEAFNSQKHSLGS